MHPDFSDLVQAAAERCWKSQSLDEALEILQPALEARSAHAYSYLIDFLIGLEREEEAKVYATALLKEAKTDLDLVIVCQLCRDHRLSLLGFDEHTIYRQTLFALADRGNSLFQTEIALNYLRGESGFQRDATEFERWIQKAIVATEEIDPVCYFVEYLLHAGRAVDPLLVERLRLALDDEPDRTALRAFYTRARNASHSDA
jgi:hypothetical protein